MVDLQSHLVIQTPAVSVYLYPDGSIAFGPDYQPDPIARAFWEQLAAANPLLPRVRELETATRALLTDDDLTAILANTTAYENWIRHRAALAMVLKE